MDPCTLCESVYTCDQSCFDVSINPYRCVQNCAPCMHTVKVYVHGHRDTHTHGHEYMSVSACVVCVWHVHEYESVYRVG